MGFHTAKECLSSRRDELASKSDKKHVKTKVPFFNVILCGKPPKTVA